jgi:hypothetical protein
VTTLRTSFETDIDIAGLLHLAETLDVESVRSFGQDISTQNLRGGEIRRKTPSHSEDPFLEERPNWSDKQRLHHNPKTAAMASLISILHLHLLLAFLLPATAQSTHPSPSPSSVTRVVQIFFIAERSYEGLPYTLIHRVSGSIISLDNDAKLTTYAITSTRVDRA